ncbi:hypothetical protein PVAND_017722 [Polypedilum vanderplanki]|uniref:Uncharacterized protein n=1 Tax=Polypedilum vanderplanki TaxID=319348 RepID=A0A9J6B8N3_POLVA|nr:hypothetical protein PVAND_017722 [Polypedilum vanderplanki]
MFLSPIYDKNPTKEELEALYLSYIAVYGEQSRKVGIVLEERLSIRYGSADIFHTLTSSSILCRANATVAEYIEDTIKEILVERGHCANHKKDTHNCKRPDDERIRIIYLANLKEDLVACPCPHCTFTSPRAYMFSHMKTHDYLQKLSIIKDQLKEKNIHTLDNYPTEPLPFVLEPFKSYKCCYCAQDSPNSVEKSRHEIKCKLNPRPNFPCEYSDCDKRFLWGWAKSPKDKIFSVKKDNFSDKHEDKIFTYICE